MATFLIISGGFRGLCAECAPCCYHTLSPVILYIIGSVYPTLELFFLHGISSYTVPDVES